MWGLIVSIFLFTLVIILMSLSQSNILPREKTLKKFIEKNIKRYGK